LQGFFFLELTFSRPLPFAFIIAIGFPYFFHFLLSAPPLPSPLLLKPRVPEVKGKRSLPLGGSRVPAFSFLSPKKIFLSLLTLCPHFNARNLRRSTNFVPPPTLSLRTEPSRARLWGGGGEGGSFFGWTQKTNTKQKNITTHTKNYTFPKNKQKKNKKKNTTNTQTQQTQTTTKQTKKHTKQPQTKKNLGGGGGGVWGGGGLGGGGVWEVLHLFPHRITPPPLKSSLRWWLSAGPYVRYIFNPPPFSLYTDTPFPHLGVPEFVFFIANIPSSLSHPPFNGPL